MGSSASRRPSRTGSEAPRRWRTTVMTVPAASTTGRGRSTGSARGARPRGGPTGAPQERNPSNANLIWSHRWAVLDGNPAIPGDQRLVADGVQIYGYIMISEDSPMGVVSHELGHDLGLPDLYDTDSSSLGVGMWDVMGTGSWNSVFPSPEGTSPAHFSAWAKATLGWLTPIEVTAALLGGQVPAIETTP